MELQPFRLPGDLSCPKCTGTEWRLTYDSGTIPLYRSTAVEATKKIVKIGDERVRVECVQCNFTYYMQPADAKTE